MSDDTDDGEWEDIPTDSEDDADDDDEYEMRGAIAEAMCGDGGNALLKLYPDEQCKVEYPTLWSHAWSHGQLTT